jgi:hypothetical protein
MSIRRTLLVTGIAAFCATPALALEARKQVKVDASADETWAAIREFCSIAVWHPAVENCVLSQANGRPTRTLSLKGGGTIVEEEVGRDDAGRSYSYTVVESPLPVDNYQSTIQVVEDGGTVIEWEGRFDAKGAPDADAVAVIEGIYQSGLDSLASKAGN